MRNKFLNLTLFMFACLHIVGCKNESQNINTEVEPKKTEVEQDILKQAQHYDHLKIAQSFDFPVGPPDAKGYYNAQKFQVNNHLGDDWNAVTGGNSDLGDPIYSVAAGYVKFAEDIKGGWGKVIRIVHKLPDTTLIESFYAHCDTMLVRESQLVEKGQQIGTIGNADGLYLAHLHFEIRDDINLPIGPGYSENIRGYLDPTTFINDHR